MHANWHTLRIMRQSYSISSDISKFLVKTCSCVIDTELHNTIHVCSSMTCTIEKKISKSAFAYMRTYYSHCPPTIIVLDCSDQQLLTMMIYGFNKLLPYNTACLVDNCTIMMVNIGEKLDAVYSILDDLWKTLLLQLGCNQN